MFGSDSNYDIGQGSGGLRGIGGDKMPSIPKGGTSEGGPSKRKPMSFRKKSLHKSMAHQMTSVNTFSHQTKTPKLPGEDAINAPTKPGTGPSLFPQGNFKKRGLAAIGPM